VEKVIIPSPPIWKREMVITWPRVVRSFPLSITTRPVTQTAEVEVKRASIKVRGPFVAENGNRRRRAPSRMTAAKLRTKILEGEKCLEKKVLILIRIFIDTSNHQSAVRIDFTEKSLDCQSKKKRALKNYYMLSRCNRVLIPVIRDF
jgi:hypothetical protein